MPLANPTDAAEAKRIQELVDEHAIIQVPLKEIASHLRSNHGVAPSAIIPPPTKRALRDRHRFAAGDESVLDRLPVKVLRSSRSDPSTLPMPALDMEADGDASHGPVDIEEAFRKVTAKWSEKYPSLRAQMFDDTPEHWTDSFSAFSLEIYVPVGPTFLDRHIQGFGGLRLREGLDEGLTKFEAAAMPLRGALAAHPDRAFKRVTDLAWEDDADFNFPSAYIDLCLAPWLLGSHPTENIQIDADLAEIFLLAKLPANSDWKSDLCTRPFYIDIKQERAGERTISGIFCTPHSDGGGFSCLVVVEWARQGIESFILFEPGVDRVRIFNTTDCDGFPEGAMQTLYEPIVAQATQIVAMARLHFLGLSKSLRETNLLRSVPTASTAALGNARHRKAHKKERAQEKTHSYFRVVRVTTPESRFGQKAAAAKRSSWSLDHLVTVNGHFRWQPHGPGRSQHRLIWIDRYDKGPGGRHRPETNPLLLAAPELVVE